MAAKKKPRKPRRLTDPRLDHLNTVVSANSPRIAVMESDIKHLHDCVEDVKKAVQDNTRITLSIAHNSERAAIAAEAVRDVQATFRVTLAAGKWVAAIGAAAAGVVAVVKGWRV